MQLDEEEKENSGRDEGNCNNNNYNNNNNINIAKEATAVDVVRNNSPTPTSRYVNGPRSSTPRKTLPATSASTSGGRRRRRCSHLEDGDQQPTLRVHWADSNDHLSNADKPFRSADNLHNPTKATALDNSVWDSDTPSLEIGQHHATCQKKVAMRPRGLRMGVAGAERRSFHPPASSATSYNFLSDAAPFSHPPAHPYGLR